MTREWTSTSRGARNYQNSKKTRTRATAGLGGTTTTTGAETEVTLTAGAVEGAEVSADVIVAEAAGISEVAEVDTLQAGTAKEEEVEEVDMVVDPATGTTSPTTITSPISMEETNGRTRIGCIIKETIKSTIIVDGLDHKLHLDSLNRAGDLKIPTACKSLNTNPSTKLRPHPNRPQPTRPLSTRKATSRPTRIDKAIPKVTLTPSSNQTKVLPTNLKAKLVKVET